MMTLRDTAIPVRSPCVRECFLDPATQLCRGCSRTIEEITQWNLISDTERQKILESVRARRSAKPR